MKTLYFQLMALLCIYLSGYAQGTITSVVHHGPYNDFDAVVVDLTQTQIIIFLSMFFIDPKNGSQGNGMTYMRGIILGLFIQRVPGVWSINQ